MFVFIPIWIYSIKNTHKNKIHYYDRCSEFRFQSEINKKNEIGDIPCQNNLFHLNRLIQGICISFSSNYDRKLSFGTISWIGNENTTFIYCWFINFVWCPCIQIEPKTLTAENWLRSIRWAFVLQAPMNAFNDIPSTTWDRLRGMRKECIVLVHFWIFELILHRLFKKTKANSIV